MFQPTHPHGVRHFALLLTISRYVFQPTHPHGVRLSPDGASWNIIWGFNPRTRTGCDGQRRTRTIERLEFQPTHPHGVRPHYLAICEIGLPFQPTHPHGVRRSTRGIRNFWHSFNPRTRTGCDLPLLSRELHFIVSTHAPARGATSLAGALSSVGIVSTHAPARGATGAWVKVGIKRTIVSTHAPARGATSASAVLVAAYPRFNPRTRTGCDARPVWDEPLGMSFNPRTRTGCDVGRE